MDAAAEYDLENGGGAVTVETWAYPADKRLLKEKQPFTWLGALLLAAGMAVLYYGGGTQQGQPYAMTVREQVGTALYATGMAVAMLGLLVGSIVADEGCCACNLPRLD